MMRKAIPMFLIAALALFLYNCGGAEEESKDKEEKNDNPPQVNNDTPGELKSFDASYMDTTVLPQDDFFQFANGAWVRDNPVPGDESSWGSFNELSNRNMKALRTLLEEAAAGTHEKGSANQMISDYYSTYMDKEKRDKDGYEPIKAELEMINNLSDKAALVDMIGHHHDYAVNAFFGTGVEQDLRNNTKHMMYASQAGLGLPSKDYYLEDMHAELREKYVAHISRMLQLIDHSPEVADEKAKAVMAIETNLATASMGPVELRNIALQYNKMPLSELQAMTPSFNWTTYFENAKVKVDTIIVTQPGFFANFEAMVSATSIDDIKSYLTWKLVDQMAGAMSSAFDQANFDFYSTTLSGVKEMKPQWKRVISNIEHSSINEALGKAFVEKHFSPESKERVNEMVTNIMTVFGERLEGVDWMSPETKEKAKEKLASFVRKLGYPDKWEDLSALTISRNSLAENVMNMMKFSVQENRDDLEKPIDKTKWGMPPQMINAYYNPLFNEIVFPAGIMQPPFFDPNAEDAINYGRMGMVIGHEFTHGFDDQGAQFAADGTFAMWWSQADFEEFTKRTAKLVAQYNEMEPIPGHKVNGQLTLGENIADLGGATLAYHAYMKSLEGKETKDIDGYTPAQRFFIGLAQIWKVNYTDEAMKQQIATNPHSPGMNRVNGPLANMPEFFEAFNVQEGDAMRQSEDKIAKIW
jgi:putative endopeptidase